VPFRVFGDAARYRTSPPGSVLSELAARSEFLARRSITGYWFCDPAAPLAISSALRFSFNALPGHVKQPVRPLFEFRSPSESCPACPSPPPKQANSSHGLCLPSALVKHGGPHHPGPAWPSSVRLQGLVTLLTAYSLRARAGSFSHRQRSWDSPFGAFASRKVPATFPQQMHPPAVSPIGAPDPPKRIGPAQRAPTSGL